MAQHYIVCCGCGDSLELCDDEYCTEAGSHTAYGLICVQCSDEGSDES